MNRLQVDPATGFLTSDNHNSFNADMKVSWLKMARECSTQERYPSIAKLARSVGIPIHTFYDHLKQDKEFAIAWKEIISETEEMLVEHMVENGKKGNGIAGTIFWLKNRVPERWSDKPEIQSTDQFAWIKTLLSSNKQYIDADIVDTPTEIERGQTENKSTP